MAQRKKPTFGSLATCKVSYVIAICYTDNTVKYVTNICYSPKECRWEDGKQALFFSDRRSAEDICFGLNVNGTGAFVMEVPDYFEPENFKNPVKEEARNG